jgi:hypothetical protein
MLYPGRGLLSWPHLNFRLTPPQVTINVGWYYKQEQTLPRSLLRWFLGLIIVVLKKLKDPTMLEYNNGSQKIKNNQIISQKKVDFFFTNSFMKITTVFKIFEI